ncbi:MAG TPA: GerMN domain-containing protein [Microbacteriaceae bacterium]|nr:GerMN domain-containing protein [Microbacteriaceae bacterium]
MTARPLARRLAGGLVALLTAGLLLTGCGGLPSSGPVHAGPALGEVDPDYVVSPSGPAEGASPQEILGGFMLAVRAPQADYQIARQFLTEEFASQWKPDAGVAIRTGLAETQESAASTAEEPVLHYEYLMAASVDAEGRYREQSPATERTAELRFVQEHGQWRIAAAPDGIILGTVAFTRAFTSVPLYFFDPTFRYLVPDVRWFASRASTPAIAVTALLAGPDAWLSRSLVSGFPAGTRVGPGGVVVSEGRAVVDLTSQASAADGQALDRIRQQLGATLGTAEVEIRAAGVPLVPVPSGAPATIDPQPSGAVLVGTGEDFGFGTASGIVQLNGLTQQIVEADAVAVTLARDGKSAAVLTLAGAVQYLAVGAAEATPIDARPGLIAPALDQFGFVWTSDAGPGSRIEAFDRLGQPVGVLVEGLPEDASIVSIAVSRDDTRLALATRSGLGSRVLVYGIERQEGVPVRLGPPVELPAPGGDLLGAAWVNDRSLVVSALGSAGEQVRVVPIGAPSSELGLLAGRAQVVGGRDGKAGIRALVDGAVMAAGADGSWNGTGLTAVFLGVQQ